MSGEGPESIPTSADPKSRRPTKKRALTPVSAQSASVEALFAKPDQEIRIPAAGAVAKRSSAAPPEIVANVQGSSAGAGSGEFHVYKASRRREYERLRAMDEEVKREEEARAFEERKGERERRDDEKTRRNRERREKMRARKAKKGGGNTNNNNTKGAGTGAGAGPTAGVKASGDRDDVEMEDGEESQRAEARSQPGTTAKVSTPVGLVIHDDSS